jgi:cell division protease FtsH
MQTNVRKAGLWVGAILLVLTLVVVGFAVLTLSDSPGERVASEDVSFAQLVKDVDDGKVRSIVIQGAQIQATYRDDRRSRTYAPDDPALLQRLRANGVVVTDRGPQR